MLGQSLDILGADELVVVRGPDVYDKSTVCRWSMVSEKAQHAMGPKTGDGLYVQTSVRMGFSGSEAGEKGV